MNGSLWKAAMQKSEGCVPDIRYKKENSSNTQLINLLELFITCKINLNVSVFGSSLQDLGCNYIVNVFTFCVSILHVYFRTNGIIL